jgi:hypothetical protein
MAKIALEHGATIDKYVGDAFLAFFGDPETRGVKQDAAACVSMATATQRRMEELQSEWRDAGFDRPSSPGSGSTPATARWATSAARTGWTTPSSAGT